MRSSCLLIAVILLAFCPSPESQALASQAGECQAPGPGIEPIATLPLKEVLSLYEERSESSRSPEPAPPLDASVTRMEFAGRLLGDAIDVRAEVEVSVLADEGWVSVPLLRKRASTQLAELPAVDHAHFAVREGTLLFLTKRPGRYRFSVAFLERAELKGTQRLASIEPGEAAQISLVVSSDSEMFRLTTPSAAERPEGSLLYPQDGVLAVGWERVASAPEPETARKPAPAPTIRRAHGSSVATLEGDRITRLRYELHFAGRPKLAFRLPAGHTLERAYLNGIPLAVSAPDGSLELEVVPARAGEEEGTLELVLATSGGDFHLSGVLDFELPQASWPVHDLYLDLHLPDVFDYSWRAGSLAEVKTSPRVDFSHSLPTPGRALRFHQYLIGRTRPNVTIDYTVNLDGQYFHEQAEH